MAIPFPSLAAPQSLADRFMPHGMCYLWEPGLLWLHVLSDVLIGAAYVAISVSLGWFVWRALRERAHDTEELRPLPFWWMFLAFGLFIVACGATHFMAAWNVWNPDYWVAGGLKAATAFVSVATAVALPPLIPRALAILEKARASERRREELSRAHSRIKELDHAKTRFFASLSHEIRTPLALVLGPVERLRSRGDLPPETVELLDVVQRNAHLLEKRVDDLLEVTRLDLRGTAASKEPMELGELVRRLTAHFASAAGDRSVDLTVETAGSTWIRGNRSQWERIVMNLLSNALKFTDEGTEVRIAVLGPEGPEGSEDTVILSVEDQGPGIPPSHRERAFEPFRQIDDSDSRRHGGYGLGLAIVRQLIELHDGTIRAEEAPGGGARLVAEVPAAPAAALPVEAPETEEARAKTPRGLDGILADLGVSRSATTPPSEGRIRPRTGGTSGGAPGEAAVSGQATVLIVEDHPDMAWHLLSLLPEGARGLVAHDGVEALELLDEVEPDLILSDVMMPDMDGVQLLREIRAREEMDDIPLLVITARQDEELKVELLREGAQDFLTKPFLNQEVEARLTTWLSVSRAGRTLRKEVDMAEAGLEALVDELVGRGRELQAALDTARLAREEEARANRAKTEFLGMMSHELRTPLNAVIGYADLLSEEIDGPLNESQQDRLVRLRSNAAHLLAMVDDILQLAIPEEKIKMEPALVQLPSLLEEVMETVEGQARKKELELHLEAEDAPGTMQTDRTRLRQILVNLLANAITYTGEGSVRLMVDDLDPLVRFRVRDTGPGIAEKDRHLIFEAFWRGDGLKDGGEEGGAGLGLAIARRLARRLGGDLTVESTFGEGTTFTLVLPRTPGDDEPAR